MIEVKGSNWSTLQVGTIQSQSDDLIFTAAMGGFFGACTTHPSTKAIHRRHGEFVTRMQSPLNSPRSSRFSAAPALVVVSPRSALSSWTIPLVRLSETSRAPSARRISWLCSSLNVKHDKNTTPPMRYLDSVSHILCITAIHLRFNLDFVGRWAVRSPRAVSTEPCSWGYILLEERGLHGLQSKAAAG
ncbi:hypothetical protein AG1IA_05676 [Rhizoctonia solani AG-1 IA]|uniref:Uncharacterized protein n=1 Tax=Thanatephorus cucumeris (strain AG1-IA) TaxID=983506 RepID=L8WU44_THACA|nr:hypothetical protein AG1IA_05676 [Rhizoctonia solani AG-1 IA]